MNTQTEEKILSGLTSLILDLLASKFDESKCKFYLSEKEDFIIVRIKEDSDLEVSINFSFQKSKMICLSINIQTRDYPDYDQAWSYYAIQSSQEIFGEYIESNSYIEKETKKLIAEIFDCAANLKYEITTKDDTYFYTGNAPSEYVKHHLKEIKEKFGWEVTDSEYYHTKSKIELSCSEIHIFHHEKIEPLFYIKDFSSNDPEEISQRTKNLLNDIETFNMYRRIFR